MNRERPRNPHRDLEYRGGEVARTPFWLRAIGDAVCEALARLLGFLARLILRID